MLYGDPDLKVFLESESFNIEVSLFLSWLYVERENADNKNYDRNGKSVLNLMPPK